MECWSIGNPSFHNSNTPGKGITTRDDDANTRGILHSTMRILAIASRPMTAALAPAITSHIEALCAAIAADESVQSAREKAETFLADEPAVALYREVMTLGRTLEQRHRSGQKLAPEEISKFQDLQDQADAHEGIQAFVSAQEVLQEVANQVNGFVSKTLEKGSVPTHDEVFGQKGCGEGCGCH
jgi:cell fate (sporulation/competence/biofilm development) regulator YlbF (YheA/YmcA/DUF963 family)